MRKSKINKDFFKILLLLVSLFAYTASFARGYDFTNTCKKPDFNACQFESDKINNTKFCLVPENPSYTILTARFISLHIQQSRDHTSRYKKLDFYKNRVLAFNHPISVYKISLSVFTAIG
jgi:hypothetical protein